VTQRHVELVTLCCGCHLLLERRISGLVRQITAAFLQEGFQMPLLFPTPLPGFWEHLEEEELVAV
jgi:hypothetical protein